VTQRLGEKAIIQGGLESVARKLGLYKSKVLVLVLNLIMVSQISESIYTSHIQAIRSKFMLFENYEKD
jgi:hypothetical protein